MLQLKNKRTYTPFNESISCNQCNHTIDRNIPKHSIPLANGSSIHFHLNCHTEIIKSKAKLKYKHNQNFPFKKQCIHCNGDTHLPHIDNTSLFQIGLNAISKNIYLGSLERTVKVHEHCLKELTLGKDVDFEKLIALAKIHKSKSTHQTPSNTPIKHLCKLCFQEVSFKKNSHFTTNNQLFHNTCIGNLIQSVFDLKTQSHFRIDRMDIQTMQNSCIFCKKSQSLDTIAVRTNKRTDQTNELTLGFHRECLLDFSNSLNKPN